MGEKLRKVLGPGCIGLVIGLLLGLMLCGQPRSEKKEPQLPPRAEIPDRDARLDLNTATAEQLQELPGIGAGDVVAALFKPFVLLAFVLLIFDIFHF